MGDLSHLSSTLISDISVGLSGKYGGWVYRGPNSTNANNWTAYGGNTFGKHNAHVTLGFALFIDILVLRLVVVIRMEVNTVVTFAVQLSTGLIRASVGGVQERLTVGTNMLRM